MRIGRVFAASFWGHSVARAFVPTFRHHRSAVTMSSTPLFDPSPYFTAPQPAETKDYCMQQTMVRVKDPAVSMKFYCEVLGFKLLMYRDFPQWGFSVYFVAHGLSGEVLVP